MHVAYTAGVIDSQIFEGENLQQTSDKIYELWGLIIAKLKKRSVSNN
jgi:hypothetical protein